MAAAKRHFEDIANKRFSTPREHGPGILYHSLVYERGTRSFGARLIKAGIDAYDDIEGRTVAEIIELVPTTRTNLNKVLHYLGGAGIKLT